MILQKLGGDYHLVIETPEDFAGIGHLDEAHWMATSAPVAGFMCDKAFLDYLDFDGDGWIRTDELVTAQEWVFRVLSDRTGLLNHDPVLTLSSLNSADTDGQAIGAAAKLILDNLGKGNSPTVTLEDVQNRREIMAHGSCNGDGVIPPS